MDALIQNFPLVVGVVFGTLMVLVGMLLVVVGWSLFQESLSLHSWPQVPAEVTSSEVVTRSLDDQTLYRPKVNYRFPAGGETVTASRLAPAEKLYPDEGAARKIADRYFPGMTVMARHHPDFPEQAVLEAGGTWPGLLLLLLGAAMVAVPLLIGGSVGLPTGWVALFLGWVLVVLILFTRVGRRRLQQARLRGLYPARGMGTDADVERLLREGEKLLAIRLYRELHKTGLKEARLRVEELTARLERP